MWVCTISQPCLSCILKCAKATRLPALRKCHILSLPIILLSETKLRRQRHRKICCWTEEHISKVRNPAIYKPH